MTKINVENATVNLLLTINGQIHLVGMSQDKLDSITLLAKLSAEAIIPTNRNQTEFNQFLNYKE